MRLYLCKILSVSIQNCYSFQTVNKFIQWYTTRKVIETYHMALLIVVCQMHALLETGIKKNSLFGAVRDTWIRLGGSGSHFNGFLYLIVTRLI